MPLDAADRVSQKLKICRHCHRYVLVGGKAAKDNRR